jgi:hypothetical protein
LNVKFIKFTDQLNSIYPHYEFSGFYDFHEVLSQIKSLKENNPGCYPLITLDNLTQTHYVAFHSGMKHDITSLDDVDKDLIAVQKLNLSRFMQKANSSSFSAVCMHGLEIDDDSLECMEEINDNPAAFIDKVLELYFVPVNEAALVLSLLPVGYFTEDLSPFDNLAIARHFNSEYGFELFGVGSSLLGFIKSRQLHDNEIASIINDLASLYQCEFDDVSIAKLSKAIDERPWLFVRYTNYFD